MGSEDVESSRFFVLEPQALGSRYDTDADTLAPDNCGEAPRCTRCGDFVGMLPWLVPHRAALKMHGDEPGDFIRGAGYEEILSERFVDALRTEGLIGFEGFHPLDVVRVRYMKKRLRSPLPIPHYRVVSPCFGRAAVDLVLNRVRISSPPICSECRVTGIQAIHGFVLEPGTWGGEDVFRPRGLQGKVVVSARFKAFVERHGFTNMLLTPTEQYVWDPSGLGPAPVPSG